MAGNPFTTKTTPHHTFSAPLIQNNFFTNVILWQRLLREKMAQLIHEAKTKKTLTPLLILIASAFVYGIIHAAGPGHGKAVALSYILSCRPVFIKGVIFGNIIALTHGFSGIFFVLTVKLLLNSKVAGSLDTMTNITQVISYSLITCFGIVIFLKTIMQVIRKDRDPDVNYSDVAFTHPFITAFTVGIIPCPGVIMVMLFAMSIGMLWLGIILGAVISVGMALTISCVVMAGMSGKAAILATTSNSTGLMTRIEHGIEITAGLALACIGGVLLITVI